MYYYEVDVRPVVGMVGAFEPDIPSDVSFVGHRIGTTLLIATKEPLPDGYGTPFTSGEFIRRAGELGVDIDRIKSVWRVS